MSQTIDNVPESEISNTVMSLIQIDDATDIKITKNPDGTWKITGR